MKSNMKYEIEKNALLIYTPKTINDVRNNNRAILIYINRVRSLPKEWMLELKEKIKENNRLLKNIYSSL